MTSAPEAAAALDDAGGPVGEVEVRQADALVKACD